MDNVVKYMPPMLTGEELRNALTALPPYNATIRNAPTAERLIELNNLYEIYYPSAMSEEIYCKLYLALLRSLQKKGTKTATTQGNLNRQGAINGIIGGSDSFTILGRSGIGKSATINRAISLISPKDMIVIDEPYRRIAPIITVQTPYDCSVKGLLLEILREVDKALGTNYHANAVKARATTDALIGSVSNICLHSVGLLIIDEFQNICGKNGGNLMGVLLNLINSSGISVAMVGTLETKAFFSDASFQLSRRSLGLQYDTLPLGEHFCNLCRQLTSYLYVRNDFTLTDEVVHWLHAHSNGVVSVVVSLLKDAQEIAILNGCERLSIATLNLAYQQRLTLLHNHITSKQIKHAPLSSVVMSVEQTITTITENCIVDTVGLWKKAGGDLIGMLKEQITIEEIPLC